MGRALLVLATFAVALSATPLQAENVVLNPAGPWNVDFGESKCRLSRLFGEGDKQHVLVFEKVAPSSRFLMSVAGPSFREFRHRQPTLLRLTESRESQRTEPLVISLAAFGQGLTFSSLTLAQSVGNEETSPAPTPVGGLPELDKTNAAKVMFVSITQRGEEVRLMTGSLDKAFKVLDDCTLDLVRVWGLDVEQQRTATRRPRWLNQVEVGQRMVDAVPSAIGLKAGEGIMNIRVIVSAEGTVENCAINAAANLEAVANLTCRQMDAARFEPALDAAGQPMRSYYNTTMTYSPE